MNTPTEFQEIMDSFLSKITDYDFLSYSDVELESELKQLLKPTIAKFITNNTIKFDSELNLFNRELEPLEVEILADGMVVEWLKPKINTLTLIKQSMGTKDFSLTSQANHLDKLMSLQKETKNEFSYWRNRIGFINRSKEKGKE